MMYRKLVFVVLSLGIAILTTGMNGGCGENRYSITSYFYPDWTPDGKIICVKKVDNYRSGGGYPSFGGASLLSTNYYITTMSEEGTQEVDVKGVGEIRVVGEVGEVHSSPRGDYIAYTDGGNYIKIITYSGTNVSSIVFDLGKKVYSFDWSPDGTKLIYDAGKSPNYEQAIVNLDGTDKREISINGSSVAWRYGNKILMQNSSLEVVGIDGATLSQEAKYLKVSGAEFSVSNVNTNEVVYRGSGIRKFLLNDPSAEPTALINRNDILNIHLSPNGQKIIGTGDGSSFDFGKEIWIVNIDGTGLKQLK